MVSTTTAGSLSDESRRDGPPSAAPRTRLRNAILALCVIGVPLAWSRDPQLVWQPLLPIPLLFMSPRGASRVLALFVVALVVIGGGVTTYRVGMAVPDWPATFNENMWTYPLEKMLEEGWGVTLEHLHRLTATAVGLVSICVVLTCFIRRSRLAVTLTAFATLFAISVQGVLGGTRVLANSQNLAFLHGVLAQAVVALIVVLAVVASDTWASTRPSVSKYARGAIVLGPMVSGVVFAQVALGAWLRHHGDIVALMIHATLALFVIVMVLIQSKQLGLAATEGQGIGVDRRPLAILQGLLLGSLIVQFTLGVLATVAIWFISDGMEAQVSVGEAIFATAHVLVGAVLLSSTVVGGIYARRALTPEGETA